MSTEAMHWVMSRNRTSRGNDRLVLLALANEADTGTGYCFPSYDTLAKHALCDRTTVMDCVVRLEVDGQLLVNRPTVRGRGRHNKYVLVMDRDPYELADLRGWSRPPLSPAAEARRATALEHRSTDVPSSTTTSVPPLDITLSDRTEDAGVPSPDRSEAPTILGADTSDNGRRMVAPGPTIPSPNPNPNNSVQRATPTLAVDKLSPSLRSLAERLAAAGLLVHWDLGPRAAALVEAQLVVLGEDVLVDTAMLEATRKGTPRSARAWVDGWTALVSPTHDLDDQAAADHSLLRDSGTSVLLPPCGHCDPNRWITDHDGLPVAKCTRCHPAHATRRNTA